MAATIATTGGAAAAAGITIGDRWLAMISELGFAFHWEVIGVQAGMGKPKIKGAERITSAIRLCLVSGVARLMVFR